MSADFFRPVSHARCTKVKGVERVQVRLYCAQAGTRWNLQVRGPEGVKNGCAEGKAFVIATASMSLADLRALRDAIDDLVRGG